MSSAEQNYNRNYYGIEFLSESGVQIYLSVLTVAISICLSHYYNKTSTTKSLPCIHHHLPVMVSCCLIGITWFYIVRFIMMHPQLVQEATGRNDVDSSYFDDAYKDVLRSNNLYFTSTQLLTWAIVSVVWMSHKEKQQQLKQQQQTKSISKAVYFLGFGFLGAMSASFVVWIPTIYYYYSGGSSSSSKTTPAKTAGTTATTKIPITYLISSMIAFVAILKLTPCDQNQTDCTPNVGFGSFDMSFHFWLHTLHVILLVPVLFEALFCGMSTSLPAIRSEFIYGGMGLSFTTWHWYQLVVKQSWWNIPETDCQISITTDLLACTVLTIWMIGLSSSSNKTKTTQLNCWWITLVMEYFGLAILLSPAALLSCYLLAEQWPNLISEMQRKVACTIRHKDGSSNSTEKEEDHHHDWCNLGLWTTRTTTTATNSTINGTSNTSKPNGVANGDNTTTNGSHNSSPSLGEVKSSYTDACKQLALALGKAAGLQPGTSVLSCGCGSGMEEVLFYKNTFQLSHITGLDPTAIPPRLPQYFDQYNARTIRASVSDMTTIDCLPQNTFDTVLALDNIYHYPDKLKFFEDALKMVSSSSSNKKKDGGGVVAVTDLLWGTTSSTTTQPPPQGPLPPMWAKIMLSLMGVSSTNVWNENQYRQHLERLGYRNIRITRIGKDVFVGWKKFLPTILINKIDYAIIVADAPPPPPPPGDNQKLQQQPKKKIAIIGSGMAGLVTSHFITSSAKANEVEVDIYESRPCPGLAGDTISIGDNTLIDVPPRMCSSGYYQNYLELVERLGVPTKIVETGCTFGGLDGNGNHVQYAVERSQLLNMINAFVKAGYGKLCQVLKACSASSIRAGMEANLTFGDWIEQHFDISLEPLESTKKTTTTNGSTEEHPSREGPQQPPDLPSLVCHDSPFLYMMIGSLCWMLSCTYEQLLRYPVDIIFPYCSSMEWSGSGLFDCFYVGRIDPSIKAMEKALLYGVHKIHFNTYVSNVDESKIINGIKYDAVICATEAMAVKKVIKDASDVFTQLKYQPSCIYVHKDESFMPPNRKDWKCWGVEMSSSADRNDPELTFWLNEFYPDKDFEGENVFESWAPRKVPREDTIIAKKKFVRAIHTMDSRRIIEEIEQEQGKKDGIFYAGSYTVYGMGLLEQALLSGKAAATKTLDYLFDDDEVLETKK